MESKKQKILKQIKLLLTIGIMMIVLYLVGLKSQNNRLKEIDYIQNNFGITKGIITDKKTFKGFSIKVTYCVSGVEFKEKDSFDEKYEQNIREGDSVTIKYSILKPNLIINQYNSKY